MDSRYRSFGRRLITVMGLGAPLVGCWTASGGSPPAHGGDPNSTTTATTTTTTTTASTGSAANGATVSAQRKPSNVPPGKFGPFTSPPHFSEHESHCVPRPDPDRLCPPDAILVNSRGQTQAPLRHERGDACCYGPAAPGFHWRGRALRGPAGVALATAIARTDWAAAAPLDLTGLTAEQRAALAEVWLRDAAFEHASVASFARLALELIALGAPPDLIADAHRAALDEIAHATAAYGIAAQLTGRALGPAPLTIPAPAPAPATLATLARDCFRDGCYGESVAVMLAHAALDATTDPALRAAYATIAADEQRHAELAYRIVAWAVRTDAAARAAIAAERATLAATLAGPLPTDDAAPLAACGVLSERAEAAVRDRTVREVVLPCVDALLAADQGRSLLASLSAANRP